VEWIFFGLAVAVVAVIGIGVGLFVASRLGGGVERRGDVEDGAFMTPVGPPPDAERPAPDQARDEGDARDG